MFNLMYTTLKSNIYTASFKQKNKLFLAKDLKFYRVWNALYIKLYNSGTFNSYLHNLSIDTMYLIKIIRILFFLFIIFFFV